jgi:signal transduction histidine kinase
MTLRSRLGTGLVIIAIILLAPLVFAIQSLYKLNGDARALRDQEFAASLLLGRLREGLNDLRREELALLFSKDSASRNAMDMQLGQVDRLADSLLHFSLPTPALDIATSVSQVAAAAPAEYGAALANEPKRADSISEHVFLPALSHADSAVLVAERELRSRTTKRVADETIVIARTATGSVVALVLALIVAAAIAVLLTRSISRPINDLKSGMAAVADGDLTHRLRVQPSADDEFGQLAQSFEEMTRQLGELDKLKAEFVSVASHELKTPINVMIGYLQLLDEGIYGPLTPEQREIHKTLAAQANALHRLVKQLLDVSRFEAGGGRLEPRTIQLEPFLAELEAAFHVLAMQRDVHFSVERKSGLPGEVYWDADRINEVLGNLLSNAFKFTPHGGSVSLTVDAADGSVVMRVHDTGAGIPPEQVPRIFEKFYQADNQGADRTMGAGLGLAIAKEIVDAHAGTITCESKVGVGTTFTIALPARATRRSSAQRAVGADAT